MKLEFDSPEQVREFALNYLGLSEPALKVHHPDSEKEFFEVLKTVRGQTNGSPFIAAVKMYRWAFNCGLADAKHACEAGILDNL